MISDIQILPGWNVDRQAGLCLPLGRAELPSSLLQGWAHSTHTGAAPGWPRRPRPGWHDRGPRALWIPGAPGDGVSATAARRWQSGGTRACPGTGGSGRNGTCRDRAGAHPCGLGAASTRADPWGARPCGLGARLHPRRPLGAHPCRLGALLHPSRPLGAVELHRTSRDLGDPPSLGLPFLTSTGQPPPRRAP